MKTTPPAFSMVATACLCGLLTCTPLPLERALADTAAMDKFGLNSHLFRDADYAAQCDALIASGVKWVRIGPSWASIEPNANPTTDAHRDQALLAKMDYVVDKLTDNGVEILWVLAYTPIWASTAPAGSTYTQHTRSVPSSWAHWRNHVDWITQRYAGQIHHWEVWNEPDSTGFWTGTAAQYRTLLLEAADIIHDAHPQNKVVMGGLTGNGAAFLGNVIDTQATAAVVDIMNYHTYKDSPGTVGTFKEFTGIMNSRWLGGRDIWITELGKSTNGVAGQEAVKADWVDESYLTQFSMPYIKRIFWYCHRSTNYGDPFEDNFGLATHTGVPRDSFYHFQAAGGAESGFLQQEQYPTASQDHRTLYLLRPTSGDGANVTNYDASGSIKRIPALSYMYFDIADEWLFDGNQGLDTELKVEVEVLNNVTQAWALHYDSVGSTSRVETGARTGTGGWITHTFTLGEEFGTSDDVKFANRQNYGADFRLFAGSQVELVVRKVTVRREVNTARLLFGNGTTSADRGKLMESAAETNPANPGYSTQTTMAGQSCRTITGNTRFLYVKVSDGFTRPALGQNLTMRLRYYDTGTGNLVFRYQNGVDAQGAPLYRNVNVNVAGTTGWEEYDLVLTDAYFGNLLSYNADFRIGSSDNTPKYVQSIKITR